MMKRRVIFFALLLTLLVTLPGMNMLAVEIGSEKASGQLEDVAIFSGDTLKMAQNEYAAKINALSAKNATPEHQIEAVVKGFLTYAKASVREPKRYDCSALVSSKSMRLDTVQYRLTEYQYQEALNKMNGWVILGDNLEFSNFEVIVNGNEATASIVESYTYNITDGFDSESFRRKMYTFTLAQDDEVWKISDIITDDPWETDASFTYAPIDVGAEIERIMQENRNVQAQNVAANDEGQAEAMIARSESAALNYWTYSASRAVNYAALHYKDTSNSIFGYNSGNNCQNFVSQCIWAGLGGSGSSKTARPAVSSAVAGSSAYNLWCAGEATTYYPSSQYKFNWTWDNVIGFTKMIAVSSFVTEGPYGTTSYSNGVQNSFEGDELVVNWDGTPAEYNVSHAMFITEVSGLAGSRTKDNVKIASHTTATNSAYMTLSSYTNTPIGNFGRVHIINGYYATQHP